MVVIVFDSLYIFELKSKDRTITRKLIIVGAES